MKYIITILLALFISSQAYAQSATEIMTEGKIVKEGRPYYVYKKVIYVCTLKYEEISCYKPKDLGVLND
mgnify:CR=1 FL=1|tara:strand:+ start:677 stop:883 length:207 start_codon:yes stop_codon:yes gene_type:complete